MVYASSARPRFPRPACKSCRTRPIVLSAPKKSSAGKAIRSGSSSATTAGTPQRAFPTAHDSLPLSRYLVYFALAAACCAGDLFSKAAVFRWRGLPQPHNEWWIFAKHFGIETSVNPGALFGMGAGWWWLFALLSVLAL